MPDNEVFICPICGEENKANAPSCRGCGADERTGFHADDEDARLSDGLDLGEDDFDYDRFVEKEFGHSKLSLPKIATTGLIALLVIYYVIR